MKTIMQNEKECYICGKKYGLESHHCLYGNNRKKADEDGLKVWLCYDHHRGTFGVHGKNGKEISNYLKKEAEKKWISYYSKDKKEFIKRYGKNYI